MIFYYNFGIRPTFGYGELMCLKNSIIINYYNYKEIMIKVTNYMWKLIKTVKRDHYNCQEKKLKQQNTIKYDKSNKINYRTPIT